MTMKTVDWPEWITAEVLNALERECDWPTWSRLKSVLRSLAAIAPSAPKKRMVEVWEDARDRSLHVTSISGDRDDPPWRKVGGPFEIVGLTMIETKSAVQLPEQLSDETRELVLRFAAALAAKLRRAEEKYGFGTGWMKDDWMDECRQKLISHIDKGDPLDVAAYCAFLWHHGESTNPKKPKKRMVNLWEKDEMRVFAEPLFDSNYISAGWRKVNLNGPVEISE